MTDKMPNYSPAQEARIREVAAERTLNLDTAKELATEFGKNYRSVIAKINRMDLPYVKVAKVTKNGQPVESKEAIVAEIAAMVGETLDGLEKASKQSLQRVRNALAA